MHEVSTLRLGDLDRRKKVNAEVQECNDTEEDNADVKHQHGDGAGDGKGAERHVFTKRTTRRNKKGG